MCRADRAKQFMPFAALKGYPEALRKKEEIVVSKVELSEDFKAILNLKIQQIHKNDIITVSYFFQNKYLKQTGMVARIDRISRILWLVSTKIPFDDIYDISGDNIDGEPEII